MTFPSFEPDRPVENSDSKRRRRFPREHGEVVDDALSRLLRKVVDAIESGRSLPWRQPWTPIGGHHNAATRHRFTGFNAHLCWLFASIEGYRSTAWWPLAAARRKHWTLRPGASPAPILMPLDPRRRRAGSDQERWTVQWYFNQDTFLGPPVLEPLELDASVGLARVGTLLRGVGMDLEAGGDRFDGACFFLQDDLVCLPAVSAFESVPALALTALHELVHWTGHPSRLGRDQQGRGTPAYAFEELVAEIGASMLGSVLGVEGARVDDPQHIGYLASWAKEFRRSSESLFDAMDLADQARKLLEALVPDAFSAEASDLGASFPERLQKGEIWRQPAAILRRASTGTHYHDEAPVLVIPDLVAASIERWACRVAAWRQGAPGDAHDLSIEGGPGDGAVTLACALLRRLTVPDAPCILVECSLGHRRLDDHLIGFRGDGFPFLCYNPFIDRRSLDQSTFQPLHRAWALPGRLYTKAGQREAAGERRGERR